MLRLLIAVVFSLPVYFLLDQNIVKHCLDYTNERLTEQNANLSDIDNDGNPETYYFFNLSESQVYLEMWSGGSLLGVWTAPGRLVSNSMVMDRQKEKKRGRLFFVTEQGAGIYINELDLQIVNKKLVVAARSKLLAIKSENALIELTQAKLMDLDGDGQNEYLFFITEALDIRNLVAYYPGSQKIARSGTEFMVITDFYLLPDQPQKLFFSSYANGNVFKTNVRRMVQEYHLDTALCSNFYTDTKSYAGIFTPSLEVADIKLKRKGFTSMYRVVPVTWDGKQQYVALSTFINAPDSLPQLTLLNDSLQALKTETLALPVPQALFNKYRKDIFYVKKEKSGDDHVYLAGQNDTVYELDKTLSLLPVAHVKGINEKSRLDFTDLDGDGHEEILLNTGTGIHIYQAGFKDMMTLETEGSALKKDHFSAVVNGKREWQFITGQNDHIRLSYSSNPWYYWKIPFFLLSILFVFTLLSFLLAMNARKIERENRRLELVVEERTREVVSQKAIAEHQRELVEEKQKEIIDSINYAKRIQSALLAKEEDIKACFPESFLLYLPKDIVAGDFYFYETTPTHAFYAAADCTGHGVPGALVSVVCANALSRCVKEFGLAAPGAILDKARELVKETLKKSGQDVKDGMDISLLVKDLRNDTFSWAGANNPLWMIKKDATRITETRPDKQPIGFSEQDEPFNTHAVPAQKGDLIYLFTDGYADQFGGEKGKKFKYRQLAEKLLEIRDQPMPEQQRILEECFKRWKGNLEQIDDVCIVGIRC